jgi:hypothetical protein
MLVLLEFEKSLSFIKYLKENISCYTQLQKVGELLHTTEKKRGEKLDNYRIIQSMSLWCRSNGR